MTEDVKISSTISKYTYYFTFGGVLSGFSILLLIGESFELIWSLINTLQLISFLPLIINSYPEHVMIMFEVLQFLNLDFDVITNFIRK